MHRAGLGALSRSPVLRLVGGLALAASGLFEAFDTAIEFALGVDLRLWHGAVVFGVAEVVKSLGDVADGAREARDARARPAGPRDQAEPAGPSGHAARWRQI